MSEFLSLPDAFFTQTELLAMQQLILTFIPGGSPSGDISSLSDDLESLSPELRTRAACSLFSLVFSFKETKESQNQSYSIDWKQVTKMINNSVHISLSNELMVRVDEEMPKEEVLATKIMFIIFNTLLLRLVESLETSCLVLPEQLEGFIAQNVEPLLFNFLQERVCIRETLILALLLAKWLKVTSQSSLLTPEQKEKSKMTLSNYEKCSNFLSEILLKKDLVTKTPSNKGILATKPYDWVPGSKECTVESFYSRMVSAKNNNLGFLVFNILKCMVAASTSISTTINKGTINIHKSLGNSISFIGSFSSSFHSQAPSLVVFSQRLIENNYDYYQLLSSGQKAQEDNPEFLEVIQTLRDENEVHRLVLTNLVLEFFSLLLLLFKRNHLFQFLHLGNLMSDGNCITAVIKSVVEKQTKFPVGTPLPRTIVLLERKNSSSPNFDVFLQNFSLCSLEIIKDVALVFPERIKTGILDFNSQVLIRKIYKGAPPGSRLRRLAKKILLALWLQMPKKTKGMTTNMNIISELFNNKIDNQKSPIAPMETGTSPFEATKRNSEALDESGSGFLVSADVSLFLDSEISKNQKNSRLVLKVEEVRQKCSEFNGLFYLKKGLGALPNQEKGWDSVWPKDQREKEDSVCKMYADLYNSVELSESEKSNYKEWLEKEVFGYYD